MPQDENPEANVGTEVFDLPGTLETFDGDKDLFQGMVDTFLEELPSWMGEIEKGRGLCDSRCIEKAAHSIKGTAGNFGAKFAAEAAYRLECLAKSDRVAEMNPAIDALRDAVASLTAALRKAVEEL